MATRMRQGRVFLAGDAAHVVSPNGGLGGNTGVQDTRNLAAVVKGEFGPEVLDSYEADTRRTRATRCAWPPSAAPTTRSRSTPDLTLEIARTWRSAKTAPR